MEFIVRDLTYVNVAEKWHYICLFIDLFNREIVGHSAGQEKTLNWSRQQSVQLSMI